MQILSRIFVPRDLTISFKSNDDIRGPGLNLLKSPINMMPELGKRAKALSND